MSDAIDISIIIPTKNGSRTLDRVLSVVFEQKTLHTYEVIVVDSGSTDNTLGLLSKYPVRLFEISPEKFSHSRTRNYGATLSRAASYLVFLNQDAIPTDEYWLENLIKSIEQGQDVKAVCAMELYEKKKFLNVTGVASYVFKNSHVKGSYVIEPFLLSKTADMPKSEQRQLFPFTTVCAIFDKKHFTLHPFNEEVEWGEDLHWAVDNSNQGYKSACTSLAKVFHFHEYSEQELKLIMEYSMKAYKEIFGWDEVFFEQFILTLNQNAGSCEASRNIDALLNSLSWKITAPFRKMHAFLLRHCGRRENR